MSDDPYMECPVYAEHGACSCSTGVYGNTCRLPGGLGEPECEEHHIALTPHIVTLGPEDEHALPEELVCRLCFLEDAIYEQGHRVWALQVDNHRLRSAIGRHRERLMSLGHDGKGKHGSEWDRELWSVLYDFLRSDDIGCKIEPHDAREARLLYESKPFEADRDDAIEESKCAQETAGFGPPCSDPMCEACRG